MPKIGICVTTCNRPNYLKSLLRSVGRNKNQYMGVVVDNGTADDTENVQQIAEVYGFKVIDGGMGNSPHGQNLGFKYLAGNGCDLIVKSDDDVRLNHNCLSILASHFRSLPDAVAIGASTWSYATNQKIRRSRDGWKTVRGQAVSDECIMMYRHRKDAVISMKHLHGVFMYSVPAALKLEQQTKEIRGGVFGEYFSPVAHREETEFTYLLRLFSEGQLYFVTAAVCLHCKADGGIRNYDFDTLADQDNHKVVEVCKKLGVVWNINPAWL